MQDYHAWRKELFVICDWSACLRWNIFYGVHKTAHKHMRKTGWELIEHNERHYDCCPDGDHLTIKHLTP